MVYLNTESSWYHLNGDNIALTKFKRAPHWIWNKNSPAKWRTLIILISAPAYFWECNVLGFLMGRFCYHWEKFRFCFVYIKWLIIFCIYQVLNAKRELLDPLLYTTNTTKKIKIKISFCIYLYVPMYICIYVQRNLSH